MNKTVKEYKIKIPKKVGVFYCKKKNIILIKGVTNQKSLKLNKKIFITFSENSININSNFLTKMSLKEQKTLKALQGTTASLIKKTLVESYNNIYQKLKLVGVGFRIFPVESFDKKIFMFKLGFSHHLYLKIKKNIYFNCLKPTRILIGSNSHKKVSQLASIIKSYKTPDPYKGKGILYENEIIKLKEVKKV